MVEGSEIVRKLKPWVSTFSGVVPKTNKHGDTVCVGGEITDIIDNRALNKVFKDIKGFTLAPDISDEAVTMFVDDGVGESELLLLGDVFNEKDAEYHFKRGMVVLAKGRVLTGRKRLQHPDNRHVSATIVCWEVQPLPEAEVEEERN